MDNIEKSKISRAHITSKYQKTDKGKIAQKRASAKWYKKKSTIKKRENLIKKIRNTEMKYIDDMERMRYKLSLLDAI